MSKSIENILYIKIGSCFSCLRFAVQLFEDYLKDPAGGASPNYYKARNYLRDAEKCYEEAFAEAKKLLGPPPAWATADFEKWRKDYLSQHHILAESLELEVIKEELVKNGDIVKWMSPEDIERLLLKNYELQKTGKRQLANIKVRIILDRIQELLTQALELKKRALEKFQAKV